MFKPKIQSVAFDGWTTPRELLWLYRQGEAAQGTFVEVGSYLGRSSGAILQAIKTKGFQAHLVCVDSFGANAEFKHIGGTHGAEALKANLDLISKDGWELIEADSVTASARFEDGSLDGVFIDGTHKFGFVKRDLEAWVPKVRAGGLLSGHDYDEHAGVTKAVDMFFGKGFVKTVDSIWWTRKE